MPSQQTPFSDLQIRALVSLVERARAMGNLTYDGKRNMTQALGYQTTLTYTDYYERYSRGGIAKRIVEAYPHATWGSGAEVIEDPDRTVTTPFEEQFAHLVTKHELWQKITRADILAGIGHYSVLVIGTRRGALDSPLPKMKSIDDIIYLTPLPEPSAQIAEYEQDQTNPRFNLPLKYNLKFSTSAPGTIATPAISTSAVAHWSRVIHIADGILDNVLVGDPRLRACWNNLDDLLKLVGGGSEAAWRRMDPGMQLDMDPELEMSAEEEEKLQESVDNYIHGLERVMRTRGIDVKHLATTVSGFSGNASTVVDLIAATTGIPQRILMGSERGQLSSEQDRNNWSDRIGERRLQFAEPLLRSFVNRLIDYGALPTPTQYVIEWSRRDTVTLTEKSNAIAQVALANKNQSVAGQPPVLTSNEIRGLILGIDPLDESELPPDDDPDGGDGAKQPDPTIDGSTTDPVDPTPDVADPDDREPIANQSTEDEFTSQVLNWLTSSTLPDYDPSLNPTVYASQLNISQADFIAHFSVLVADTANSTYNSSLDLQPRSSAFNFQYTSPQVLEWARAASASLITYTRSTIIDAIRQFIVDAIELGLRPAQLTSTIKQIIGLRPDQAAIIARMLANGDGAGAIKRRTSQLLSQRARLIARTELNRASNEGQRIAWLQMRADGLLEQGVMREWVATPDERTRDHHAALHGVRTTLDQPWVSPDGGGSIEPGQEPNCLLPGTKVSGAFVAGLKAGYSGPVIHIQTRAGNRLSVTPNHPVFTDEGWIPAHSLRQGHQLVSYGTDICSANGEPDNYQPPAAIEDVFESIAAQGYKSVLGVASADLHGDTISCDGDIEVVVAKRELTFTPDSLSQVSLKESDVKQSGVSSPGSGDLHVEAVDLPSASSMSSSDLSGTSVAVHIGPLQRFSLGLAAECHVRKPETTSDSGAAYASFLRELQDGSAGRVTGDEVVNVDVGWFDGHVYDLQSVTGWMVAENTVISNCRCTSVLVFPDPPPRRR